MIVRLSKALLVCAIALFASLVAFGNITDYGSNFAFVRHVFMMDTIFPRRHHWLPFDTDAVAASRRLYLHHRAGEPDRAAVLDRRPAPAVRPETAR